MQFVYRARDDDGALVTGEAEASSLAAMQDELFQQGLIPLHVRESKVGGFSLEAMATWLNRVKAEELMVFTRQLYTLFRAGVSIDSILGTLGRQAMGKTLRTTIESIKSDVNKGSSLSESFAKHPRVFNPLYVAMIAAGEEAGILEQSLSELTTLIEKEETMRRNVKSATFYPKIVVTVLAGAIFALMTFVVPKFEDFFGYYGADLPFATVILITTSHFIRDFWYLLPGIIGGIAFAYKRYASTRSGRFTLDQMAFKYPVFGDLNLKVSSARYGHILGSLYKSGLSMPRCLEVVSSVIGNEAYGQEVRRIRDDIQRGMGLADAMQQRQYFPPLMVETTAVGERAGSLDEMLEALAQHYDLEVEQTIKNLTTLLEPLMLVLIFGVVTIVALAIFLPIWGLSSAVLGGG